MKKTKRILAMMLLLAVLSALFPFSGAAAVSFPPPQSRTVRVGWYEVDGLQDGSKEETLGGYNYEFLLEISRYAGWNYEFVFGTWEELEQKLIAGEIDLLGDVAKTSAREKAYDYCIYPNGYSRMLMACRPNDDRFAYNDYAAFDGITVATIPSTFRRALLDREAEVHGFTVHYQEYESEQKAFRAVDERKADVVIFSNVSQYENCKVISEWEPNPFYFVVSKTQPAVLEELNDAMVQIQASDVFLQEHLFQKHFGEKGRGVTLAFTKAELAYLGQKKPLKVMLYADRQPFVSVKDGKVSGFVPDYCALLEEKTGLRFEYVVCDSYQEMLARFQAGEGDLCAQLHEGTRQVGHLEYTGMRPYLTLNYGYLHMPGTAGHFKTVAIEQGDAYLADQVVETGAAPLFFASSEDCANAVLAGDAEAALIEGTAYEQLAHHVKYQRFTFTLQDNIDEGLFVGISSAQDKALFSILSKATGAISDDTISDLLFVNSSIKPDYTLDDYVKLNLPTLFFAFVLVLTVGFVLLWYYRQRNYAKSLEKANEEIRRADEVTNSFFSNLSHDMRTPLTGILGYTELALEERPEGRLKEYLDKIQLTGRLLLALINDTLELSKIRSGKYALHPEPVQSLELLRRVVTPIEAAAGQKNQQLVCEFALPEDEWILMDRLKLQDILMNLLSNAVKYTQKYGTVWFSVEHTVLPDGAFGYRFCVKDNGIGMSEGFQKKVFEPFEQENAPESEGVAGTGLGLSVAKQFAEKMGGQILLKSKRGAGSEFTVVLPVERCDAPKEETSAAQPQKQEAVFAGVRLLLCEDNEINAEIFKTLLGRQGAAVTYAENGLAALETFSAAAPGTFDAILMDLRMPVMDGLSAARAIRALPRADAATIPILAMSADAYDEDVKRCLEAGMNGHIAKPIEPEVFFAKIKAAIEAVRAV